MLSMKASGSAPPVTNQNVCDWLSKLEKYHDRKGFLMNPELPKQMHQSILSYMNHIHAPDTVVDLAHLKKLLDRGFYLRHEVQQEVWRRCVSQLKLKPFKDLSLLLFAYGQLACQSPVEWGRRFMQLYQPLGGQYKPMAFDAWMTAFATLRESLTSLHDPEEALTVSNGIHDSCRYALDRLQYVILNQFRPKALLEKCQLFIKPNLYQGASKESVQYALDAIGLMVSCYQRHLRSKVSPRVDLPYWGQVFVGAYHHLSSKDLHPYRVKLLNTLLPLASRDDWLKYWMNDYDGMDQTMLFFLLDHLVGIDQINDSVHYEGVRPRHLLVHFILSNNKAGVVWLIKWSELRRMNLFSHDVPYAFDIRAQNANGLEQAIKASGLTPDDEAYAVMFTTLSNALIDPESLIDGGMDEAPASVDAASVPARAPSRDRADAPKPSSKKARVSKKRTWRLSSEDLLTVSRSHGMVKGMHDKHALPIYVSTAASSPRKRSGGDRSSSSGNSGSEKNYAPPRVFTFETADCQAALSGAAKDLPRAGEADHCGSGVPHPAASSRGSGQVVDRGTAAPTSSERRHDLGMPASAAKHVPPSSQSPTLPTLAEHPTKRSHSASSDEDVKDTFDRSAKRARSRSDPVTTLAAEAVEWPWSFNPNFNADGSQAAIVLFRGVHFHNGPWGDDWYALPLSPAVRDCIASGMRCEDAIAHVRAEFAKMSSLQAADFHRTYSNTYDRLNALIDKRTCLAHFGADFSSHPYVSFGSLDTALAYMQGTKFSGRNCKNPCLPEYDEAGEPKHKRAGLIQCCLITPDQAVHLRPCMVAYAKGQAFDHRIVAEREVSAIAAFDGQIFAEQWLIYPSLSGPYTNAIDKRGLTEARYEYYQASLGRVLSDDARRAIELELLHELASSIKVSGAVLAKSFSNPQYFGIQSEPGKPVLTDVELPLALARVLYHYHNIPLELKDVFSSHCGDETRLLEDCCRMITAYASSHHQNYGHMLKCLGLIIELKDLSSVIYLDSLGGFGDLKQWVKTLRASSLGNRVGDLLVASTQHFMSHLSESALKWLESFLDRYPDPDQTVERLSNERRGILQKWLAWDFADWFNPLGLKYDDALVESIRFDLAGSIYPRGRHPDAKPGALALAAPLSACPPLASFAPWSMAGSLLPSSLPKQADPDPAEPSSDAASASAPVPSLKGSANASYQWFIEAIQRGDRQRVLAYLRWITAEASERYPGNAEDAIAWASPFLVGESVDKLSKASSHPSPLLYAAGYQSKDGVSLGDREAVFAMLFDQRILDTEFSSTSEDPERHRILHWAVRLRSVKIMRKIFRRHPHYKSTCNDKGRTPLHLASASGQLEAVQFLVEHGEVVCYDRDGKTPLDLAREAGHADVVAWLAPLHDCIAKLHDCFRASYNLLNTIKQFDVTPFVKTIQALSGSKDHVRIFKHYAESVRSNPPWSVNAPHLQKSIAFLAVEADHLPLVDALLKCGIRINHRPQRYQGRSFLPAFVLAVQKGFVSLVQCVLGHQPAALLSTQHAITDVKQFDWSTLDVIVFAKNHPTNSSALGDALLTAYHEHRHDVMAFLKEEYKGFSEDLVMPRLDAAFDQLKVSPLPRHGLFKGSVQGGVKGVMACRPK